MIDFGTLKLIEFFAFFGGILLFGYVQLRSLKKLDQRDRIARAEAEARGESQPPQASSIPGWMTRR